MQRRWPYYTLQTLDTDPFECPQQSPQQRWRLNPQQQQHHKRPVCLYGLIISVLALQNGGVWPCIAKGAYKAFKRAVDKFKTAQKGSSSPQHQNNVILHGPWHGLEPHNKPK